MLTRSPICTRSRDLTNLRINVSQNMDPPLQTSEASTASLQYLPQVDNVIPQSLKLPPFYNKYPQQWFILAESQFRIRNVINENIKYEYLLLALSQDLFATVSDVIQNINDNWLDPNNTPYISLKEALLERNSLSESQRLETLLKDVDIGDKKPSEFSRTLKQTAGQSDSITDKLITQLWIRKLPIQIQISLKTLPNPDIKTLLNMADSIYEIFLTNNHVHLEAITTSTEPKINYINQLENQIKLLTESVEKLIANTQHVPRHTRFRSRSSSRSNKNQSYSTERCWYHHKFGDKAKKCIPPCNFAKNQ